MDLFKIRNELMSGKNIYDLSLKVTFYGRVSTDKDEQLNSLDNQVFYFQDFIKKCSNWIFIDGYIDEGLSGTSVKKRDSFLRMMNDAKDGLFDLILTKEISRFARDTLDSIQYTRELLNYGVGVYFHSDNINTIFPDSELRLTIMASIAQEEVRKLSERVRFGMKRSIEKNRVLGNNNIWGYVKNDGKLIIVEEEAEMIKELFFLYSENKYGFKRISDILYEKGYKNNYGKRFSPSSLTQIIRNPKYKGYYFTNRVKRLDYKNAKQIKVPREEWIAYECNENIPPIVSEELWNKANKILKERSDSFINKQEDKAIFQHRYAFSGRIFCKEHGTTFNRVAGEKRENRPTWICRTYIKEGKKGCESPIILETELYDVMKKIIQEYIDGEYNVLSVLQDEYENALKSNNSKEEIKNIEEQINAVKLKKDKLLDLSIEGVINNQEFAERNELFNKQIIEYEKKSAEIKNEYNKLNDFKEYQKKIDEVVSKKMNCEDNIDYLIQLFIKKIIISKINNDRKHYMLEVYFVYGDSANIEITPDKVKKK